MTDKSAIVFKVAVRNARQKQNQALRQQGIVPGVVYGRALANTLVQCDGRALTKLYHEAGDSSLVDLVIDEQAPIKVLIHDVSHNVLTDEIEHVDFYAVNMTETIQTDLPLQFVGLAPAVKELDGTLLKNKSHLKIKCLPQALVKDIAVDVTSLKTFDDTITVKDVTLPPGIEVLDQPDDIVALVTPPRSDEELAALNQAVSEDVSKVEGVVKASDTKETKDGADNSEGKKEKA